MIIPFSSCEGDVEVYKNCNSTGAAYLSVIVRYIDSLDIFSREIFCKPEYDLIIKYDPGRVDGLMVRSFRLTWNGIPNILKR